MTTAENARWRQRVKKEDEVLTRAGRTQFRLSKSLVTFPTPPQHLNAALAKAKVSWDTFQKYDLDGNGVIDVDEMREVLKELGMHMSEEAIIELQKELDLNGDGIVQISELQTWWNKKIGHMTQKIYADPTKKWGQVPEATSREVGWFVAREPEISRGRRASQMKWRYPKTSCAETLYATEYVKFAGASPYSNKGRAEK